MAASMKTCFFRQASILSRRIASTGKIDALAVAYFQTSSQRLETSGLNSVKLSQAKPETTTSHGKVQQINRAMQVYLENMVKHDAMMAEHEADFEMGRRYLANMMGADPENFTQEEIDEAIEYLLPSGLHSIRSRPMMRHPKEIFPVRKAAEFDSSGRPFHPFFFTGKPNYYELMHTAGQKIHALDRRQATQSSSSVDATSIEKDNEIQKTKWIAKEDLQKTILEEITDSQFERFLRLMDLLVAHSHSHIETEYILSYRIPLITWSKLAKLSEVQTDEETGLQFTTADGARKTAKAHCKLTFKNTSDEVGKFTVNDAGIDYFTELSQREQVMTPLVLLDVLGKVDIECTVTGSGMSAQAGAVRLAISNALAAFQTEEVREGMRQVGLLTRDPRMREREKPGQRGARAKKTWKKR